MKRSFLIRIKEFFSKKSSTPWACFETNGPTNDGIMEFSLSWNDAFIKQIKALGYTGGNDEELVQLFFLATRAYPENIAIGDTVNPGQMPNLSSEANSLRS